MLIENPVVTIAACSAAAVTVNLAMLKVSPQIKARARHAISGVVPTIAMLGGYIGLNDSVVASGTDLMVLGASALLGVAGAVGSTVYVTPQKAIERDRIGVAAKDGVNWI